MLSSGPVGMEMERKSGPSQEVRAGSWPASAALPMLPPSPYPMPLPPVSCTGKGTGRDLSNALTGEAGLASKHVLWPAGRSSATSPLPPARPPTHYLTRKALTSAAPTATQRTGSTPQPRVPHQEAAQGLPKQVLLRCAAVAQAPRQAGAGGG